MTFYTFANATTAIPLTQLDANFATPITLGNTAVTINGTFSSIGNLTLNNATIASGNSTVTKETVTTITSPAATNLTIQSAGTTAMTIDTSQNVGIGTSSPVNLGAGRIGLTLNGSTDSILWMNANGGASGYLQATTSLINLVGAINTPVAITAAGTGYTYFVTGGAERMRIDSSGNLLVGTTTYLAKMTTSWNNSTQTGLALYASTTTFNGSPIVFYNSSGGISGYISQTASTVAYNTSSDYRLKENVLPLTSGLTTISALKPVKYDWKIDGSHGEGFIAHELQEVIPHAVTGDKDAVNEDGSIKPQGVDYSKIVVHLVAALQELKAEFDAYKASHP